VSLEGSGPNVYALTRTLDGVATLTASKGALTGLNVEQLLRRLERRPLSGGSEFRTGRTPFETLSVKMKIVQGNVAVEDADLRGPAVRLALAGEASIPARDLELKGLATLVTTGANAKLFELPFSVHGPWDDPLLLPDAQILIQRSGAAAPLLEALRARRDSVRNPAAQESQPASIPAAKEAAPETATPPLTRAASSPPESQATPAEPPQGEQNAAAPTGSAAPDVGPSADPQERPSSAGPVEKTEQP
jgi:AsmA protein